MTASLEVPVFSLDERRYLIVIRVSVSKTVGRDQVDHIAVVESLVIFRLLVAGTELIRMPLYGLPIALELDIEGPRLCLVMDVEIQKKIVGIFYKDGPF